MTDERIRPPADRRVILHIGTEKTGSTTLQRVLTRSESRLEDAGFHYVRTPRRPFARDIAAVAVGEGYEDYLDDEIGLPRHLRARFGAAVAHRLVEEAASLPGHVHTSILSSEHFHSRLVEVGQVRRLAELVAPFGERVEVVCYLRPQADLVTSHYSTRLRMGETRSLDEVGTNLLRTDIAYCDYLGLLERFAEVFGEESVIVRVLDRSDLVGGDVVTDFAHLAGIDPALLADDVERLNSSVSAAGQDVLRALNLARADGIDPTLAHHLADLIADAFPGRGHRLSPDVVAAAEREFAADNDEVRRRWRPDRSTLFGDSMPAEATPVVREPGDRRHRSPDEIRIAELERAFRELTAHRDELAADVAWLNREMGRPEVRAVRKLLRRPGSRGADPLRSPSSSGRT